VSGGVPPSSRAGRFQRGRTRAASLYERFTGHDAEVIATVKLPPAPPEVAVIGECTAICYSTVRDGRREEYIHEFRKVDRPHLCVDPTGRQLLLIGGNYDFTELGIVDASDAKHSPRRRRR
jgi:hypothetical protein